MSTTTARALKPKKATPKVPQGKGLKPKNPVAHLFLGAMAIYFLIPFWWIIVASSKDATGLFGGGSALWFNEDINYVDNLIALFTFDKGIYSTWLMNSAFYALSGGVGATVLAVLAGYAFAKYAFAGRRLSFSLLLGAVMVPQTALVIPTFILLANMELTNTVWSVILPSLLNPFGVYLMYVYAKDAVPDELLDAARVDGAGEFRTFIQVAFPLLRPAVVTVLLLSIVSTWNNYFLPLAMISDTKLLPVTVGIGLWQGLASGNNSGGASLWGIIVIGALVSIIPLAISFLSLQRYWQGGLSIGSLK
jgi:multiple sugar transport system permease protein